MIIYGAAPEHKTCGGTGGLVALRHHNGKTPDRATGWALALFGRGLAALSGLIGAMGSFGGFLLPSCLGLFKDLTGTYGSGMLLYGLLTLVAWLSVVLALRSSEPAKDLEG